MGFGQGAAGNAGNGFQLLVTIFMELFGGVLHHEVIYKMLTLLLVSLGQLIGAISPNIQVSVFCSLFMSRFLIIPFRPPLSSILSLV